MAATVALLPSSPAGEPAGLTSSLVDADAADAAGLASFCAGAVMLFWVAGAALLPGLGGRGAGGVAGCSGHGGHGGRGAGGGDGGGDLFGAGGLGGKAAFVAARQPRKRKKIAVLTKLCMGEAAGGSCGFRSVSLI